MDEVVLVAGSDLSKLRGANDGVGFNGTNNYVSVPILPYQPKKTFTIYRTGATGAFETIWSIRKSGATVGLSVYIENNTVEFWSGTGAGFDIQVHSVVVPTNGQCTVEFEVVGLEKRLTVNGVTETQTVSMISTVGVDESSIGLALVGSLAFPLLGVVIRAESVGQWSYIKSGDFGSPTLPDHFGFGNDGTLSSVDMWTKIKNGEPVEVYDNATIYEAQLPEIPVEFQNVTDIDTDAPPTNDVFWGAYDSSWLRVRVQGAFLAQLRETYKEDEMVVRTQNGADLGAGTAVDATLSNGYVKPSYLQATSDGILKIKFEFDTTFTDVILQSEGSMYPVGTFIEIDVDNSTATMADVTLGYTA